MKKIFLISMFLILAAAASFPGAREINVPDLTIAVGATANPANRSFLFNLVVTNTGSADTPSPTRDKLILYYWGPEGQDPPRALKEIFITTVPVIKAGENFIHVIEYPFTRPGKYTYSAHVNIREMKAFEESDFLNNSILSVKELRIDH